MGLLANGATTIAVMILSPSWFRRETSPGNGKKPGKAASTCQSDFGKAATRMLRARLHQPLGGVKVTGAGGIGLDLKFAANSRKGGQQLPRHVDIGRLFVRFPYHVHFPSTGGGTKQKRGRKLRTFGDVNPASCRARPCAMNNRR